MSPERVYIAVDGPDGSGKSTLARGLVARLAAADREVVHVREPGTTPFAEGLRSLLLDPRIGELDPLSEALTFSAARRELIVTRIAPALARGAIVVAERCFAATWVYQCHASATGTGIDAETLAAVTAAVHGELRPTRLLLVDVPVEEATRRLSRGGALDRIEARGEAFQRRVHAGFRAIPEQAPWIADFVGGADHVIRLDGGEAPERLVEQALEAIG